MSQARCIRCQMLRLRWGLLALAAAVLLSQGGLSVQAQQQVVVFDVATAEDAGQPAAAGGYAAPKPSLVGAWDVQRFSIYGSDGQRVVLPATDQRYVAIITDKTFTLRNGSEILADMTYVADLSKTPGTLDVKSPDGKMLGLFQLRGDALRVKLDDESKGRPVNLSEGRSGMLLVLSRNAGMPLFVIDADGRNLRQILAMPEYNVSGSPDWSHDGKKIAIDASRPLFGENWTGSHVFVVNADGNGLKDLGPGGMPSWSPDDKQLTYSQYGDQRGVAVMNADGTDRKQIAQDGWGSQWCPKRNEIAFVSNDGGANICVSDSSGGNRRKLLEKNYKQVFEGFTWSPDGKWICFKGTLPDGGSEVAAVSAEGEKKGFKVLLPSSSRPESDNVSKTMTWGGTGSQIIVTMQSSSDRMLRLYVLSFDGGAPKLLPGIPDNWMADDAAWSPDGKKVTFSAHPSAHRSHRVLVAPAATSR
jgi:uncharacterized protein (TIGR03067 family)